MPRKQRVKRVKRPRLRGAFGFTVPEAGKMIGLSRNSAYAAAKAGEIPTVRVGALLIVPKAAWLRKLGIEDASNVVSACLENRGAAIPPPALRGA